MKNKKYNTLEKKAFYTGLGVGLTGESPTNSGITRKAFLLMSEQEQKSYINGYERGLDNSSVLSGIRKKKKWF